MIKRRSSAKDQIPRFIWENDGRLVYLGKVKFDLGYPEERYYSAIWRMVATARWLTL